MVTTDTYSRQQLLWDLLNTIPDPDIPVLSIVELGLVEKIESKNNQSATVYITPSYSGCPAMGVFREEIIALLHKHGYTDVDVKTVLSPPWSTDRISNAARQKMREYGIAPPESEPHRHEIFNTQKPVTCPRCNTDHTTMISRFGSTPCKALWHCHECAQPFEYFKCY